LRKRLSRIRMRPGNEETILFMVALILFIPIQFKEYPA
jgi:hypothetical protein